MSNINSLAKEQSSLLEALAGQHGAVSLEYNPRGLQVYQANRAVLAEKTLAATYPVVAELIGFESFEPLARNFWRQHPPQRGDMGQWGEQLADFLAATPQLADEPFLADVARIEWALHSATTAPDAELDAASFALLSNADVDAEQQVSLTTCPGVFVLASAYPVVSIINAHLLGQPTLAEAGELIRQGSGEQALVWRQCYKPRVRLLLRGEHALITALIRGQVLERAVDKVLALEPAFDFNAWLGDAVQTGLVTGAVPSAS